METGSSRGNTRDAVVLPVTVAAVYLTIVTSVVGWWRPAILEPKRRVSLPGWLWVIPALAVIGFALVGCSGELMTRGLLYVVRRPPVAAADLDYAAIAKAA